MNHSLVNSYARNYRQTFFRFGITKLIMLFIMGLFVQGFEIMILPFRQVNKTVRDNSFMQIKRVTTMNGILIWKCNSIRYFIQSVGSRTKFFLEILATLAAWCKNLKTSQSSFCMQLHLLFWSVCIRYFLIRSSNNSYFIFIITNISRKLPEYQIYNTYGYSLFAMK